MRRLAAAGLVFAASAAVAIPHSASAGGGGTRVAGEADGSGRTGNLIALVRTPGPSSGSEEGRGSLLYRAARDRISAVLDRSRLRAVRSIPQIGAVAVQPAPGTGLAETRRRLASDPAVEAVEVERFRTVRRLPNDPALIRHDPHAPSHDFYQWNLRQEHFGGAWKRSRGRRARLAVIDTGMDGGHRDLTARI